MNVLFKLLLFISISFVFGCNKDVTIIGSSKVSLWHAPSTVVISKSVEFANGTSQGVIKIQVFNEKNNPISGVNLNTNLQSSDISFVDCTTSDAQGIIFCSFVSTVADTYDVDFTDGSQTFNSDIAFIDNPSRLDVCRVSNTHILKQTVSGYTSITGLRKTGWAQTTPNGSHINIETPYFKLNNTNP